MYETFKYEIHLNITLQIINIVMLLMSGFVVGKIIDGLFDTSTQEWELYIWACIYLGIVILMTMGTSYASVKFQAVSTAMKGTALRLIYGKVLSLQYDQFKGSDKTGRLTAVAAGDLEFLDVAHLVLLIPSWFVALPLCWLLLYLKIGLASFVAVGMIVFYTTLKVLLSKRQEGCQIKFEAGADSKLKLLSNIIEGIKAVKMYAWEPAYKSLLSKLRNMEMGNVKAIALYEAGTHFFQKGIGLSSLLTIATYVYLGNELTPEVVLGVFVLIQISMNA
jgi:ABC-type multidrug transport system fused ATPase/permease subunit